MLTQVLTVQKTVFISLQPLQRRSYVTNFSSGEKRSRSAQKFALLSLERWTGGDTLSNRCPTCRHARVRTGSGAPAAPRLTGQLKKVVPSPSRCTKSNQGKPREAVITASPRLRGKSFLIYVRCKYSNQGRGRERSFFIGS